MHPEHQQAAALRWAVRRLAGRSPARLVSEGLEVLLVDNCAGMKPS